MGIYKMIIKTENSELEISIGTDVYLGSRASGQIFKKWDDFEDNQKVKLEIILNKIENLIFESEKLLLETQAYILLSETVLFTITVP